MSNQSSNFTKVTTLINKIGEHHKTPEFKKKKEDLKNKEYYRLSGGNYPQLTNTVKITDKIRTIKLKSFKATSKFVPPFFL